jgi:serine phosphatase RsbU (regulator of sigma subunit)
VITTGNQTRWMAFQTSLLFERDGETVEGLLAIGRDITDRIETERLIHIQHKNIADSMAYANRIRLALQPEKNALASLFTHYALVDEPKDMIGGDFVWLGKNGNAPLFVLGDCTGHGVPGAFMTTISMSVLREIVREDETRNPEELLGKFNRLVHQYLGRNSEHENYDSAEISMISLDYEKRELLYISSGIGLYRVRNGEAESFREASRGLNSRYDYSGMGQRIPLEPGDVFYMFTDGVYDQIGGESGKRLSRNRLLKIIQESDRQNLAKGMEQIRKSVHNWQGSFEQIDDRMMISFRI